MSSTAARDDFQERAADLLEQQFARVSAMREFHAGTWIQYDYYARHLLETLLRIRLNNAVDAYALFRAASVNDPVARHLVRYLADEYGHDELFLRDVEKFGISTEAANATAVLRSTESLMGYLRNSVDQDGPLCTTVWNCLVEWYSDRYNRIITDHAARVFGAEMVRGSYGHLDIDEALDHDDFMWQVLELVVARWGSERRVRECLEVLVTMIGDYFQELYDRTAVITTEPSR